MLSRIEPAQSVWKIIQARAGCLVGEVSALTAVPQVASNTPPSILTGTVMARCDPRSAMSCQPSSGAAAG